MVWGRQEPACWVSSRVSLRRALPSSVAPQEVPAHPPEVLLLPRASLREVLQLQETPEGACEAAQWSVEGMPPHLPLWVPSLPSGGASQLSAVPITPSVGDFHILLSVLGRCLPETVGAGNLSEQSKQSSPHKMSTHVERGRCVKAGKQGECGGGVVLVEREFL